jgi:hypothetical protein
VGSKLPIKDCTMNLRLLVSAPPGVVTLTRPLRGDLECGAVDVASTARRGAV